MNSNFSHHSRPRSVISISYSVWHCWSSLLPPCHRARAGSGNPQLSCNRPQPFGQNRLLSRRTETRWHRKALTTLLKLWDARSGMLKQTLVGHVDMVVAVGLALMVRLLRAQSGHDINFGIAIRAN